MKVINLGKKNSVFNNFISQIREIKIQQDSMRFRRNLERIGEVFAYEISKELDYDIQNITTPLGTATSSVIKDQLVLATILRAGLPLHQGFLNYFDNSESAFISAYRNHETEEDFNIKVEYLSMPNINGKVLVIVDPMIATGKSFITSLNSILKKGNPKYLHIVGVIASKDGVEYLQNNISLNNCSLWIGNQDQHLNSRSYIVPGLGDAGDLAYGKKL
jgi:uracil phosphoribosyltransferase